MLEYLRPCIIEEEIHTSGIGWSNSASYCLMHKLYIKDSGISPLSNMNKAKCFHQSNAALSSAQLVAFWCWILTLLEAAVLPAPQFSRTYSLCTSPQTVQRGRCQYFGVNKGCHAEKKTNIKNQCIGLWISQEHESVKKGELWLYRRKDRAYICILVLILHLKCCCFLLCQHLGTCCSSLRVSLDALDALRGLR